jgi:hypothetical protein
MRLRLSAMAASMAILAAGCGAGTATQQPVPPSEWKSVIRDWYDGRFDHRHRCAAVREAIEHLPTSPPTFSSVREDFNAYEKAVCVIEPQARRLFHWRILPAAAATDLAGVVRNRPGVAG